MFLFVSFPFPRDISEDFMPVFQFFKKPFNISYVDIRLIFMDSQKDMGSRAQNNKKSFTF